MKKKQKWSDGISVINIMKKTADLEPPTFFFMAVIKYGFTC